MHAKTLHDLEFPRILGLLAAETTTPPGANLALAVRPSPEPAVVQRENNLTGEAVRYLAQHGALPFGTIIDPLPMLDRLDLDVGGSLVELRYVGPAHTEGDVIVHLPEERVVFHPVSLRVNRADVDDPGCIEPVPEPPRQTSLF